MNNLSFCWNCWIRCVEIYVICVELIFLLWAFFSTVFHNIEVFSTFLLAAFPCKYWLWQLWKMFLVLTVWLIPANGWVSKTAAYFSRHGLNGLVLHVIGGRSNACCAFLTGLQYSVLPLHGCAASFTCAGHFLAFMSCFWITYCLQIYVVPFSNAKVVGSFRMARLNMFRRKEVA